jgi:hypothetical protein
MSLKDVLSLKNYIWSARLSTGLFGLTNCPSGNRGPKNDNEIMLFVGDEGLRELIKLGFISCPSCHPEKINIWDKISDIVIRKYGIDNIKDFTDKKVLPFEIRRINWGKILPIIGKSPSRFYMPAGLTKEEVNDFKNRIVELGCEVPSLGYYQNYKFVNY